MPIVSTVGRKSPKVRSLIIFIYAVLILGAATTVFPFLVMAGTSVASHTDFQQYRIAPRYLYNGRALMAKYLQEKHRTAQFEIVKLKYHVEEPYEITLGGQTLERKYGHYVEMESVLKDYRLDSPAFRRRLEDWAAFKDALPDKYKDTNFQAAMPIGEVQVAFQKFLRAKYDTIKEANSAIQEQNGSYVDIFPPFEAYDRHAWYPPADKKNLEWAECRKTMPPRMFGVVTVLPIWQNYLRDTYGKIENLNAAWDTSLGYFWQIPLELTRPAGKKGGDWEAFVRRIIPMRYVRLDRDRCRPSYLEYLRDTYGQVEKYNGKTGDNASSLETAELPEYMPQKALPLFNWQTYYETHAPIDAISIDSADVRYARFLEARYADIQALNRAYEGNFASFGEVEPPWREEDYLDLFTRRAGIRWDYITRNYTYVVRAVFLQGRPLVNTFILVTLTVLSQITINPLAAYALSRYRLSYSAKVLIFLLATMAFPAQVTMIPNFLLIRDLGLLNTFAALVLPGLANGYYVFLLKGFFDSLPQELYEAGSIDGASEFRMFWTITLPLSAPVLAVIALFAFSGAYGSFMWALTTCQDPRMWTIMVYLQQFQQSARFYPYLIMASLVVAAIPTVIVFLAAQRVLMRGIVVPMMK